MSIRTTPLFQTSPPKTPSSEAPNPTETKPEITPEVSPTPEIINEAKTETTQPEKIENSPVKTNTEKPLFETVIITVPKSKLPKITKTEVTEEKPKAEAVESVAMVKPIDENISSGATRPRIIQEKEIEYEETPPCQITVSEENISLLNGGGSLGVLVGMEGEGDAKKIAAQSSSPTDIEAKLESEIGNLSGRTNLAYQFNEKKLGLL